MTTSLRKRLRALKISFVAGSRFHDNVVEVREFRITGGALCMTFASGKNTQSMIIQADDAIEKGIINIKKLKEILPSNVI